MAKKNRLQSATQSSIQQRHTTAPSRCLRQFPCGGVHMERTEMCVCGHPQPSHRTYGCTGSRPNPDPKKSDRLWCQCKMFQPPKLLMSTKQDSRFLKIA